MIAWWWLIVAFVAGLLVGTVVFTLGVVEMIQRGRLIWLTLASEEDRR